MNFIGVKLKRLAEVLNPDLIIQLLFTAIRLYCLEVLRAQVSDLMIFGSWTRRTMSGASLILGLPKQEMTVKSCSREFGLMYLPPEERTLPLSLAARCTSLAVTAAPVSPVVI